jgi:hypothetical protein
MKPILDIEMLKLQQKRITDCNKGNHKYKTYTDNTLWRISTCVWCGHKDIRRHGLP